MKNFISPVLGLEEEAEAYFRSKPKYTPKRVYTVIGSDADLKERVFLALAQTEAESGAVIEIKSTFEGAHNQLYILPWGEETLIATTPDFRTIIKKRRSKDHSWVTSEL